MTATATATRANVDNILAVYSKATPTQLFEGTHWYDNAFQLALELSPENVWRGAGVISAFSPMCPWWRNEILAKRLFETGIATGHTTQQCSAAQRIYNGEHPLDVLGGDKTRAFTCAIADPNTNAVTIDRHAHDIAMGRIYADKERKIGKRVYRALSEAYTLAANEAGTTVSVMQAVTWVVWRETL